MPRSPVDYSALTERRCRLCGQTKPVAEFGRYVDASAPLTGWRYYSRCKACNRDACKEYGARTRPKRNARMKKWRKANPEKAKENNRRGRLKMMYGLPPDIHAAMVKKQKGRCAICREEKPLCVDHCHSTGAVRKLLCNRCNFIVGIVESSPKKIEACRLYLTSYHE